MCLLTNERYKTYQTGFSFGCLGHMPQGWDFGVLWGVGGPKKISPKIQPVWCVSYLHEWHMQTHNFWVPIPLGPWGGAKRSISFNLNHKVNFIDFSTKLVCPLTNERYKTYQTGFSFGHLSHAPGVGLWGTVGGWKSKKKIQKFNQIWYVSYLHECQMQGHTFLGPRLLGPWGGAKRSNIIKSQLQSQF